MIAALVFMPETPEAPLRADQLARTLSALVPAAIEGIVTDVVVVGRALTAEQRLVVDQAGCRLVESAAGPGALGPALQDISKSSVFALLAGYVPDDSLAEELHHGSNDRVSARRLQTLRRPWPFLPARTVGVLAPLDTCRKAGSFAALCRLRPAPALRTRARPAL